MGRSQRRHSSSGRRRVDGPQRPDHHRADSPWVARVSSKETPMLRAWWEGNGGRVCEEFPLVLGVPGRQQRRRVDGLVAPDEPSAWLEDWRAFGPTEGRDLIVVQAKASALAMPLLGQSVFSAQLARDYLQPASVRSVL